MKAKSEVYSIYFDDDLSAVVMDWDGYATSEQFKEGTEIMLNKAIEHNTTKVLADIKEMTLIGMEDQKWLEKEFLPKATKQVKSIAMVRPDSYFNKVAVESVSYKLDKDIIDLRFFDKVDEARDWLRSVSNYD